MSSEVKGAVHPRVASKKSDPPDIASSTGRASYKLYLADPAITPSILMKGKALLEDPLTLSRCVERAVVSHLESYSRYCQTQLSYWRSSKEKEVDIVVSVEDRLIPFEIKYQSQKVTRKGLAGLFTIGQEKARISYGYVLTKSPEDTGLMQSDTAFQVMRIPASFLCYWLGASEALQTPLVD